MRLIPLVCRICHSSRDTMPSHDDPRGTAFIIARCFECGQKAGHDPVVIEYMDRFGRRLK